MTRVKRVVIKISAGGLWGVIVGNLQTQRFKIRFGSIGRAVESLFIENLHIEDAENVAF